MFGVGSYFASNSSKSDNYTKPAGPGGLRCLLVVRVCLGEPYKAKHKDPMLTLRQTERTTVGHLTQWLGSRMLRVANWIFASTWSTRTRKAYHSLRSGTSTVMGAAALTVACSGVR
eukprot:COSAG05_NODE_2023_length_3681_cov_2.114182_4_plen_116_part_00